MYKFQNGLPTLHPLKDLCHHRIVTSQPGKQDIEIELHNLNRALEALGVWSNPVGHGNRHLQPMLSKAQKQIAKVRASSLKPAEAWQSFRTQALPLVKYGFTSLMMNG